MKYRSLCLDVVVMLISKLLLFGMLPARVLGGKGFTDAPTETPTFLPSSAPTKAPSLAPVSESFSPTVEPISTSPFPSSSMDPPSAAPLVLTLAPVAPPTEEPTTIPTSSPSLSFEPSPSVNGDLLEVILPQFDLLFVASDFPDEDTDSMTLSIHEFFQEAVKSAVSTLGELILSVVKVKVNLTRRRRQLQSSTDRIVLVEADGTLYYEKDPPSRDTVERVLRLYFEQRGYRGFIAHLEEDGVNISGLEIALNGIDIVIEDGGRAPTPAPAPKVATTNEPSPGLVVGLVVGCSALLVSVGLLIWQRRKERHKEDDERDHSLAAVGEASFADEAPMLNPGNRNDLDNAGNTPQAKNARRRMEDDQMSFGGISLEDSIYTSTTDNQAAGGGAASTTPSVLTTPFSADGATIASEKYDAKRLDKVISNAHNYVNSQGIPIDPTATDSFS